MHPKDIIVIGASAGGIEALSSIAAGLPPGFEGSIFVVVHTSADSPGVLDSILDRAGPLPARMATDGEKIAKGTIYVAPPDRHLILEPGRTCIGNGPKENRFRPAIDPLFRSAAQVYGPRAVGVILTGHLDDGTAGMAAIRSLGGTVVVQDPREALVPSMPESVIRRIEVDYLLPLGEIAPLLVSLASSTVEENELAVPDDLEREIRIAKGENALEAGVLSLGEPTLFSCPECRGVLLRVNQEGPVRFRCHTGHAYTLDSRLAETELDIEAALWNAVRAIEERALLLHHAADHVPPGSNGTQSEALRRRADATSRRAELVRQLVAAGKQ